MKYILCIDDSMGIKFNKRRVSKDIEIIKDILTFTSLNLIIDDDSIDLFQYYDINIDSFNNNENSYHFTEKDIEDCSELILYLFNKKYPSDTKLTIDLNNYKLDSTYDFTGNSHDIITRKVYKKR